MFLIKSQQVLLHLLHLLYIFTNHNNKGDTTSFIDSKLQHGKSTMKDKSCEKEISKLSPPESWESPDNNDIILYREVMRVYCALEDGSAYEKKFKWDQTIKDN